MNPDAPLFDASVVTVIGMVLTGLFTMITSVAAAYFAFKARTAVVAVEAKADANLAATAKLDAAVDGRLTQLLKTTEAMALEIGRSRGRAEKGAEVKKEVAEAAAVSAADVTVTDRRLAQTGPPDGNERRGAPREDRGTDP